MLCSGQWKRIFWLEQTIFIYFFRDFRQRELFLSSGNLPLNESFIQAIAEGFFSLVETVTLYERFFVPSETVTAMSENQFLKAELIFASRTDFLASENHFPLLSQIFFKESFIPVGGNAFFRPKEQYRFLFKAFFPAS